MLARRPSLRQGRTLILRGGKTQWQVTSSLGGKYFGWNGKVLTARLQIGGRRWQWSLKVIDEEKAEALMTPFVS
jgi:hypothetical protein